MRYFRKWKLVLQRSPQYESIEFMERWLWLAKLKAWWFVQLHPWGAAYIVRRTGP